MTDLFRQRLQEGIIICDGAMGTYLNQKGVPYDHCLDELNLSRPDLVAEVHREYIMAGAEIIETNTFGANLVRLSSHGLEDKVREINLQGARIARQAAEICGADVLIAGSIGPLGKQIEPLGKISHKLAADIFTEQAESLLEGGVDLLIVETMANLPEMIIAINAIKKVTDLPVVAQMTYIDERQTLHGNTPAEVVAALVPLGVDVIGANCSVGPQAMLEVVRQLAELKVPVISVQPNAGLPRLYHGRFVYFSSPDYMAGYARQFAQAGARIIGGCCGTTPAHIAAIREALRDWSPNPRGSVVVTTSPPRGAAFVSRPEVKVEPQMVSPFLAKLERGSAISVEIDPPKGASADRLIKAVADISAAGADAVNIADSPLARVRMSCLALAYLIRQSVDIDIVLHFTTRDRNLMGLQADLLGAHALGIRNILALTGDPPATGDYPQATAVYDVDSIGLVNILSHLNRGTDFFGNSIGQPTSFAIGVAANPTAPDYDLELSRLERKVAAGAQFIFTQPIYDVRQMEKFLADVAPFRLPIMLGVLPLVSYKHAEFLHNEVPGIVVPGPIRERMRKAGEKSAGEGKRIALELIEKMIGHVAGIYLMPSFGRFQTCLEIVRAIRTGDREIS